MPTVSWFAYAWPNRRSDKPVVEITLDFQPADQHRFPRHSGQVRELLQNAGILGKEDDFPCQTPPEERMAWYASLLARSALLFQRKAGHRVEFMSVQCDPGSGRCMALVEHEHCDVGMTAVKLAVEMMAGKRRHLKEPFLMFEAFARERLLPRRTAAIIAAARARDIPVIHLERSPYKRGDWDALVGGKRICPNGLVMLGHGRCQRVLDGTWSLDLGEDLAPLDGDGCDPQTELPEGAAERVLDRLFPAGNVTRMPIIAVTGTNGKTTTVSMLNSIMRHAGKRPGMVCSNGTFLDNRRVDERGACTDTGHLQVLTSKDVDIAVLEAHHAGIMARGFCFDWCDVGVCLNVTNDHLGVGHIDTVEQMAELKRALPERARRAAVLNADDAHCRGMIDAMTASALGLVSMQSDAAELNALSAGRKACLCVLETVDGAEWLVLHDAGQRMPLLPVKRVPATFDGTARFNVSNAMHAALAAYQAGVEPCVIAGALGQFSNDFDATAGRMNQFDGLPFKVIMDYAHNVDGFRRLAEFVSRQNVAGRKILLLNQLGDRLDEDILASVAPLAGHFDHYVCRNYRVIRKRSPEVIPALLKQGLEAAGVAAADISMVPDADAAVRYSLSMARPGDLLVLLAGNADMKDIWQLLSDMAAGRPA